jgi:hypothetical protein
MDSTPQSALKSRLSQPSPFHSSNMSVSSNVGLVFGASGVSGWAVTKELLSYPSSTTFKRVIGLGSQPFTAADRASLPNDSRLELYSGIDLRQDLDDVKGQLGNVISNIGEVTHVYYCGTYYVGVPAMTNYDDNDTICGRYHLY